MINGIKDPLNFTLQTIPFSWALWVFGTALCIQTPAITMWMKQSQSELCVVDGDLKSQKVFFYDWSSWMKFSICPAIGRFLLFLLSGKLSIKRSMSD